MHPPSMSSLPLLVFQHAYSIIRDKQTKTLYAQTTDLASAEHVMFWFTSRSWNTIKQNLNFLHGSDLSPDLQVDHASVVHGVCAFRNSLLTMAVFV